MRPPYRAVLAVAVACLLASPQPGSGQVYPPGFNDELVINGLTIPTCFVFTPDGRILVGEQSGNLVVFENGQLLPTPMLTLSVERFDEQGLLGMELAPGFPNPPYLYLVYTPSTGNETGNANQLSRFTVNGDTIDPASEHVVLGPIPAGDGFHVGGCVRFAPDGRLFVSTGDTGWLSPYPQDRSRLEGKLLRVNPDGTIPSDNPFVGVAGVRPEIYQWGLRNPFRFSIQPGTGIPFIGDVGYNSWEEVDTGPPGANFGWPVVEGIASAPNPAFVDPIFSYDHSLGSAAIVGNVFYQGSNFPAEYSGNFFFFDHSRGHLGRIVLDSHNQVVSVTYPWIQTAATGLLYGPVDLELGPDGALYYCTYAPGAMRRIFYTGTANRNPTAVAMATPTAGYAPLAVSFNGGASYDVDGDALSYQWSFGDVSSPSIAKNPTHTYTVNGTYAATLTVTDGRGGSNTSPPMTITVGNLPPDVTVLTPADSSLFIVDHVIAFAGSARDLEEGAIPASQLHWTVLLHHLNHVHPVIQDMTGQGGSFVAGSHGESLAVIWYEIIAWASDATGLRGEQRVAVLPDPAQPQLVARTYTIAADNRDAMSARSEVRSSGYAAGEPYDIASNDPDQATSAMEFALDVPKGATIQHAFLTVRACPLQGASDAGGMAIHLYDVDDAAPFTNGLVGDLIGHHPLAAPTLTWPAAGRWTAGDDYVSPDLSPLVQAFVSRPGYAPGNFLGLVASKGTLEPGSFYGWDDFAAGGAGTRLTVVYLPPATTAAPPAPARHAPFVLAVNVPNPFNPATTLPFTLYASGAVRLRVFDLRGRLVRTLLDASLPAGAHSVVWNGLDDAGRPAASGIYWCRLEGWGTAQSRALTMVR